jgi:hypothetical protein
MDSAAAGDEMLSIAAWCNLVLKGMESVWEVAGLVYADIPHHNVMRTTLERTKR